MMTLAVLASLLASALSPAPQLSRRDAASLLAAATLPFATRPAAALQRRDGQQMQRENAELETSPLIEELKRRTEANKEKNKQLVSQVTNAAQPPPETPLRSVRYDGVTRMYDEEQMKQLRALGYELDCPPSMTLPCTLRNKKSSTE